MNKTILAVFLFTALAAGCNKKKGDAAGGSAAAPKAASETQPAQPAPPATPPSTAPSTPPPTTPPAPMTGGSPVAVKDLGTYADDDMGDKARAFEVTNHGKSVVTHLQFYVWYYDKDKNGLGHKPSAMNYPESLGIKPGETKVLALGFAQGSEPAGTAFVEAPLTEVEFADGSKWENEKDGYPDRPMGGAP